MRGDVDIDEQMNSSRAGEQPRFPHCSALNGMCRASCADTAHQPLMRVLRPWGGRDQQSVRTWRSISKKQLTQIGGHWLLFPNW